MQKNAIFVPDYADLTTVLFDELRSNFCGDKASSSSYDLIGNTCEKNECLENNGGCSDRCVNTFGSFECQCTENRVLANDGQTCVKNYCADFGHCTHGCENTINLGGFGVSSNNFFPDWEQTVMTIFLFGA